MLLGNLRAFINKIKAQQAESESSAGVFGMTSDETQSPIQPDSSSSLLHREEQRQQFNEGEYISNDQKSMTERREDALMQGELNNLLENGDDYWNSGTGFLGKLGMDFGDSGRGERLFHELNKLGLKSKKENYAFINQELKNAGLDYQLSSELLEEEREKRQEGGIAIDEQMNELMLEEEAIPLETAEESVETMLPDEEMEDNYVDFVIDEALDEEEEQYLLDRLNEDSQLSIIFDKVVETASEFVGSGLIEGQGSAVSDSIPARLSDGEFVMTSKATEQIGSDTLQELMDLAEQEAEGGRQTIAIGGLAKAEGSAILSGVSEDERGIAMKNKEAMRLLDPRLSLFAS